MSLFIQKYLYDCQDSALTPEFKSRLTQALIPKPVDSFTKGPRGVVGAPEGMPNAEVDRARVDEMLEELEQAKVQSATLTMLKSLIQSEIYYELEILNDEHAILALRYLESQDYDRCLIEDCINILETPADQDISNPGAFIELLSESLRVGKYQTLAMAVMTYLEQCMSD
jgi:hypothetical protein